VRAAIQAVLVLYAPQTCARLYSAVIILQQWRCAH